MSQNIYLCEMESCPDVRDFLSKVFCSPHMMMAIKHDFPGGFEVLLRSCPTSPIALQVISSLRYDWFPSSHS